MKSLLFGLLFLSVNLHAQIVTVKTTNHLFGDAVKLTSVKNYDGSKPLKFREFSYFVQDGEPFIAVLSDGGKTAYPVDLSKNYIIFHYENGKNIYLCEEKAFVATDVIFDYGISFNSSPQCLYILKIINYEIGL